MKKSGFTEFFLILFLFSSSLLLALSPPDLRHDPDAKKFAAYLESHIKSLTEEFVAPFSYSDVPRSKDFFEGTPSRLHDWSLLTYVIWQGNENQVRMLVEKAVELGKAKQIYSVVTTECAFFTEKKSPFKMALLKGVSPQLWDFLIQNKMPLGDTSDSNELYPFRNISWQTVLVWQKYNVSWRSWFYNEPELKRPLFFTSTGYAGANPYDINRLNDREEVAAYFKSNGDKSSLLVFDIDAVAFYNRDESRFNLFELMVRNVDTWKVFLEEFAKLPPKIQEIIYTNFLLDKQSRLLMRKTKNNLNPSASSKIDIINLNITLTIASIFQNFLFKHVPEIKNIKAPALNFDRPGPSAVNPKIIAQSKDTPPLADDPDGSKLLGWLEMARTSGKLEKEFYAPFEYEFTHGQKDDFFPIPSSSKVDLDFRENFLTKLLGKSKWTLLTYVMWAGNENQIRKLVNYGADLNHAIEQKIKYNLFAPRLHIRKSPFKMALERADLSPELWTWLLQKGMKTTENLNGERYPFRNHPWTVVAAWKKAGLDWASWFVDSEKLKHQPGFFVRTGYLGEKLSYRLYDLRNIEQVKAYFEVNWNGPEMLEATKATLIPELYEIFEATREKAFKKAPEAPEVQGALTTPAPLPRPPVVPQPCPPLTPKVAEPTPTSLQNSPINVEIECFDIGPNESLIDLLTWDYFEANIRNLTIRTIPVHKEELEFIAQQFPEIESLTLNNTDTSDADMTAYITKFNGIKRLVLVNLSKVSDLSLAHIKLLPALKGLTLIGTKVNAYTCQQVQAFKKLEWFEVGEGFDNLTKIL